MNFENLLIQHGAPTLAGMKTGALFWCPCPDQQNLDAFLSQWNCLYCQKGLALEAVKQLPGRVLFYLYRPGRLLQDLQGETAQKLLDQHAYPAGSLEQVLEHLKRRLTEAEDFPHEIGLFLGYAPEDVDGFIRNKGQNFQCCGCWKVYEGQWEKEKLFARYKKCQSVYGRLFAQGRSLWKLTVMSA